MLIYADGWLLFASYLLPTPCHRHSVRKRLLLWVLRIAYSSAGVDGVDEPRIFQDLGPAEIIIGEGYFRVDGGRRVRRS